MAIEAFVSFQGECRNAVEFYAEVFETEQPQFMTFGDGGMSAEVEKITEAEKEFIMYSDLVITGSTVMFCDVPLNMPFTKGDNISLTVISSDKGEIEKYFNRLKEGGTVGMDLQETFWSPAYGMVYDKFGVSWQLSYDDGREHTMDM